MRDTYQLWVHREDNRVFAVRLTRVSLKHEPQISGVCGPLDTSITVSSEELARYPYQAGDDLESLRGRWAQFRVFLPRAEPISPRDSSGGGQGTRSIYALWVHQTSHEIYAVRLQARTISGACGPLAYASLELHEGGFDGDLSNYDYEDARALARVREQRKAFTLLANRLADYASLGVTSPWEQPDGPRAQVESRAVVAGAVMDQEARRSPSAASVREPSLLATSD